MFFAIFMFVAVVVIVVKLSRVDFCGRSRPKRASLGFDLCGIAPADDFPELTFLREWIDRGYAGEMAYMSRSADRRADVRAVVPGARSVIVTGTLYNTVPPYAPTPAPERVRSSPATRGATTITTC